MRCVVKVVLAGVLILGLATAGRCSDGESKSMGKALLLSLLLPGAGQQYLGNTGRAHVMYVSEAAAWGTFAGFRIQGNMREDKYREMANLFAGVEREMDEDYYLALAHYMSSEDYNIDVMREARYRYPDDREQQLVYFDENGYFGDEAWQWESQDRRLDFRRTRTDSRDSYRRAVLTTGFAVLNRAISIIDIYLSFRLGHVEKRASYPVLKVEKRPDEGFCLYLSTSF